MSSSRPSRSTVVQDSIPLPSEQPLEVDYLQHRHRAYQDSQVAYNKGSKEFVAQPLRTRTISWDFDPPQPVGQLLAERTDNFHKAVEKLKVSRKGKKDSEVAAFRFEESKNWGDVVAHVRSASQQYSASDSVGGKIRKFFRKVGDNGKSIQSFVGLLPDGEYKTLCGGLTLILTAMAQHADIREKMAELMDELPDDIVDTEEYIEIYGGSKLLRQLAEQQYVDILLTLEYFVKWYMQSTIKHAVDSLRKNTNYSQHIDNQLRSIGKTRLRMEKTRTRFAHKRLKMMHSTMLQTHGTVLETQGTVLKTHDVVNESHRNINQIQGSLEDLKKGGQEKYEEVLRTLQSQVDAVNGLRMILADESPNAEWRKDVKEEINALIRRTEEKDKMVAEWQDMTNAMSYTPKSLAKLLDLNLKEQHHVEDIDTVQARLTEESLEFQLRARWVAKHPSFLQDWYKSGESSLLVVQAHHDYESLSPVSCLLALTYEALKADRDVLVLPFFCGLHPGDRFGDDGGFSGPMLICLALLIQMLNIKGIDWARGNNNFPMLPLTSNEVTKLVDGSFSAYLKLVCNLVTALRSRYRAVFVLCDGLDWYDMAWAKDIQKIVRSFQRLAAGEDAPGVLKILLSTTTHASGWPSKRDETIFLDIPDEIDEEDDSLETIDILDSD